MFHILWLIAFNVWVAAAGVHAKISMGLVGELNPYTQADYLEAGIPLGYIFPSTYEERTTLIEGLKPVAQKYEGKINLAIVNTETSVWRTSHVNLKTDVSPAFAIHDIVNKKKYPLGKQGKDLTTEVISRFVEDFFAGNVDAVIKSQPVPEKQDNPVAVVVGHSYNDIVLDNKKDVLVLFYNPLCQPCQSFAPIYEKLGELFKGHTNAVTIAKIDETANDVPDEVEFYPFVRLFKAGNKSSTVDYGGERDVESLAKFVRDNGSHHIDVLEEAAKIVKESSPSNDTLGGHSEL